MLIPDDEPLIYSRINLQRHERLLNHITTESTENWRAAPRVQLKWNTVCFDLYMCNHFQYSIASNRNAWRRSVTQSCQHNSWKLSDQTRHRYVRIPKTQRVNTGFSFYSYSLPSEREFGMQQEAKHRSDFPIVASISQTLGLFSVSCTLVWACDPVVMTSARHTTSSSTVAKGSQVIMATVITGGPEGT